MADIYSPTQTEDYLRCPRYRKLNRLYEPREQAYTPNMDIGTAIHAGLAVFYALDTTKVERTAVALLTAEEWMSKLFQEGSDYALDACLALVEKGLKEALKVDLLQGGTVKGVELELPHMRIDLLHETAAGELVVTDYKVTLKLDKSKLGYRIPSYDPSWQLLQYPWGVREYLPEHRTPKWSQVLLIALTPRPFAYLHAINITDARLDDFAKSAAQVWTQMGVQDFNYENARLLPPMNTRACHDYNQRCAFYDFCHINCGDESMAAALYERKEAR